MGCALLGINLRPLRDDARECKCESRVSFEREAVKERVVRTLVTGVKDVFAQGCRERDGV